VLARGRTGDFETCPDMRMQGDSPESEWTEDCGSAKHEAIRANAE